MRLWLLALAWVILASESRAATLRCVFTEPFYTLTFDTQTGTVTELTYDIEDPDTGKPIPQLIAEGARLRVPDPNDQFSVRLEKGSDTILELHLNGQGSDGMSEFYFPFEARRGGNDGGCDTAQHPAYDPYDVLKELGLQ
jgi:hypothetical protein